MYLIHINRNICYRIQLSTDESLIKHTERKEDDYHKALVFFIESLQENVKKEVQNSPEISSQKNGNKTQIHHNDITSLSSKQATVVQPKIPSIGGKSPLLGKAITFRKKE